MKEIKVGSKSYTLEKGKLSHDISAKIFEDTTGEVHYDFFGGVIRLENHMNDLIAKGYKNFDSKLSNDETWITRSNRTDLEKTTGFNFLQKSKGCYIFAVDK